MSKGAILKLNVLDYDITILQNKTQQGCKQRIQIQLLKRQTQFLGRVMLPEAGFVLKIGQWGSNGPLSVILGGPFFRERGSKNGGPKRYLNLLVQTVRWENEPLLTRCRHFGTFWATEKVWARITADFRMFVWWSNDSNEDEKGKWESKRL